MEIQIVVQSGKTFTALLLATRIINTGFPDVQSNLNQESKTLYPNREVNIKELQNTEGSKCDLSKVSKGSGVTIPVVSVAENCFLSEKQC